MKLFEDKILINKLYTDGLSPEEREKLNRNPYVDGSIREQWRLTDDSDSYIDEKVERKIFHNITKKIEKSSVLRRNAYRYWAIASIALLLICGSAFFTALLNKEKSDSIVCYYILNSGRQSMESVKLSDGTSVILNAGSRLVYPKRFRGDTRKVTLCGQAFFKVHHDPSHPFIVKTKNMVVECLGTEFEVFNYNCNDKIETILLEGKVRVETRDKEGRRMKHNYILHPNEKLTYDRNNKVSIEHIDANAYSAWREGGCLSFRNAPLSMILPRLEEWYDEKIVCPPDIGNHYRFTFTVRHESLNFILNMISGSTPLDYKLIQSNCYVIKYKR